ncbi:MAG: class I SAM-dependent methyltransferase [Cytophagales bacterium]|jgi:2-polyprenyl-3-methyl-5-hydroxy-6-metoxy-1,4-benzoquinol methylase|nr:class I SAM-dependent methyltransferase [Cytophagales bacterium]MCA6387236.1 class I SAM-dependent methyltransferase [Cytophagales bacterium]MCA6392628.1 class I SAM-dependent methyltransferase [Cytophagales bacterium]MCA6395788.1 class I SAM-dependent methyltransferase [Cytophagales bacterium]MCA6398728.1 class I SAM-dependent methyltransferase [Cytophagales bacterium]
MSFDIKTKPEIYFNVVRKEMLPFVPSDARVTLEIGCGDGNFAELLLARGALEVWGIEYEKEQADLAQERMMKVLVGDVAEQLTSLPDNYFDVIICNDVLEHLIDPYTVISKLRYKLKKEGVMISSIPNIRYFRNLFDYFFNKNWDYTDSGIMDKTHFRFFTYRSIRKMFESNGYEVVKMEGINPTKSIRPFIWNLFFLGSFWDIRYLQFATIARPK